MHFEPPEMHFPSPEIHFEPSEMHLEPLGGDPRGLRRCSEGAARPPEGLLTHSETERG